MVWVAVAVAGMSACVQNPPPAYGQQGQQQPGYAQQQPSGLTCVQIVQCLSGCNQDAPCFQGCIAQGNPQGQAAANALLACNSERGSDACGPELQACSDASQPVATAQAQQPEQAQQPQQQQSSSPMIPGQQSSNENLLNWLVGSWVTSNHQFTFWPGGRVRRANGAGMVYKTDPYDRNSSGRCVWTLNEVGQASIENGQLVMRFDAVDSNNCGAKESSGPVTIHYQIEWIDNYYYRDRAQGLQLRLRDLDCPQHDDMYCLDSMTRRVE